MNLLDKVIFHLTIPHVNIVKTIYFNFKTLPFRQAIRLPVYIYGPVSLYWTCGKCMIDCNNLSKSMIKLGCNNEFFNGVNKSSFIYLQPDSILKFNGPCAIACNYNIRVSSGATLEFGKFTFFGSSVKFICSTGIKIGDYTRIAYESQLIDTNSHYVVNLKTKAVARREGKIRIGSYNWIGNRTTINKGTITKDYTIVTGSSLLNKDYSKFDEIYQVVGGMPAKVIASDMKRVFSTTVENRITDYFNKCEDSKCVLEEDIIDDMTSIEYWFEKIM